MEISYDMMFIIVIGIIALAIFCTCKNERMGELHEGFAANIADADISAIRNLNGLANTLMQPNGTLTNPGNLKVDGNLNTTSITSSGPVTINGQYNINPHLVLKNTVGTWATGKHFTDYRFIKTETHPNAQDGPFKQFNVGPGGVSIGQANTPEYGSNDALYVTGNTNIKGSLTVNDRDILAELDSLKQNAVMKNSQQGQCRDVNTGFNDEGGGNAVFLDRHNISCGANETLQQFKLGRSGGGQYRYDYKCCKSS